MPKNDFKAFAISENANVLKQTEYELLPALDEGFQSGIARSEELNKVWRQASTITSVIASFMANKSGQDVLDNGDLNTLQNTLLKALLNNSISQLDDRYLNAELNLSDINDAKVARDNLGLSKTVELAAGALQKDKNLSDVPDKLKARANLELVKQTSSTDTTNGALLLNGGWGVGGYTIKDEIDRCGFLSFGAGSDFNPNGGAFAHINMAVSGFYATRLAVSYASAVPTAFLQTINGDKKNAWVPLLTSDNGLVKENNLSDVPNKATSRNNLGLGTAATKNVGTGAGNVMEVGARGWAALAPNGATDTVTSVYWGVAGSAFNPDANAGYAHLNIAVSGTYRVRMAIQYSEGKPKVYVQNIGTTYGEWVQFYTTANKPTAADVGAQSDTRMGAEIEVGSASFTTSGNGRYARAPAGHTLTGLVDYNHLKTWLEDIDSVLARPIQKQINGTWYTVSQL